MVQDTDGPAVALVMRLSDFRVPIVGIRCARSIGRANSIGTASPDRQGAAAAAWPAHGLPASVDHTLEINADPAAILGAFFDPGALKRWWRVLRSVTTPRVLGVYAIEWPPTPFVDEVFGPLGGVLHGTVVDYRPDREFLVADVHWLPPAGEPVGPMALHVSAIRPPGATTTRLRVLQTGGDDTRAVAPLLRADGHRLDGLAGRPQGRRRAGRPMTRHEASPPQPELKRVLGLWDIVFFTVVAVTGLRWISRGARAGAPSVLLWVLAWLAFFVPLAVAVSVLAKKYPEQGGIYAWVHRAFGPFGSALCGWCLWVNNLFYFPALLLFAAANAAAMFGDLAPGLGDNRLFSTIFVLGFLWFTVSISIQGFEAGRWLQNVGVIGTWVPVAFLIVGAAVVAGTLGSQTSLAPSAMVPRVDAFGTISLWSGFCFAFAGFEIGAFASQEIHNPERTLPRGIAISGLIVTLIYIAGTVAVLIIVPADVLAERSGIADAVDVAATQHRPAGGRPAHRVPAGSVRRSPAAPRGWPAAPASPTRRRARASGRRRSAPCTRGIARRTSR